MLTSENDTLPLCCWSSCLDALIVGNTLVTFLRRQTPYIDPRTGFPALNPAPCTTFGPKPQGLSARSPGSFEEREKLDLGALLYNLAKSKSFKHGSSLTPLSD